MVKRLKIKGKKIIAFQDGEHRILENGCIVIEGNTIIHVGINYKGHMDEEMNANSKVITPGFINCHLHPSGQPLHKSYIEDRGQRQFYYSGIPDMFPAIGAAIDKTAREASVDYSMAELIRTGTTTAMTMDPNCDYVAQAVERSGLRAYIAFHGPYRSARWVCSNGKEVKYEWDEKAGIKAFHHAVDFVREYKGKANGRIQGFLSCGQSDTCTEELFKMSRRASEEIQVPIAVHTCQSVFEFQEMVRRHGMTPLEWLESIDFLNEWCILGHVVFISGHSWLNFKGNDLAILAKHGVSIAHSPWVFARRGQAMESFPAYIDAGVNVCLGTDTCPQSMIEAMRWAAVIGKIMIRQTEKSTAADVFNAATINAAKMLQRSDIGRIAPGAKADLLFWNASSLFMTPLRDPIKNIVYSATPEDLVDVMIDGNWVMQKGKVLHVDEKKVVENHQKESERVFQAIGPGDWANRSVGDLSPQTFKPFQESSRGF